MNRYKITGIIYILAERESERERECVCYEREGEVQKKTHLCIMLFLPFSDVADGGKAGASSDEEDTETPQEKKLRLAKQYLAQLEKEGINYKYN